VNDGWLVAVLKAKAEYEQAATQAKAADSADLYRIRSIYAAMEKRQAAVLAKARAWAQAVRDSKQDEEGSAV
jgi:hypothetical protein